MLIANSSRRWLLVPVDISEPISGFPCSSSIGSSWSYRQSVLLSNKSSRILHDVVGVSGNRGRRVRSSRRHSNGWACILRAVQADSACKLVEKHHSHEAETEASKPSASASLFTTKPVLGQVDSSLESTLEHRIWLGFGISAIVGMILKALLAAQCVNDELGIGFGVIAAYIFADLGTGIYHWGIDNYGDAKTPIFGSQIDAFQGHHRRPWTITKREFANNIHAIARPVGFVLLPFLVLPSNPTGDAFLGLFLGLVVMSQQFHSWAHSKKSQLSGTVNFLQENGILVSRKMHGAHHRPPYSINYCIVSGLWNPILNESKFFPRLEVAIYSRWGFAPRCWADTVPVDWLQEGSYFEDGSDIKLDREM